MFSSDLSTQSSTRTAASWTRRMLFGATAAATGGALLGAKAPGTASASVAKPKARRAALRPPALRPGDRVRVVSPGSTPDRTLVARGIEILRSWGLEVETAPHVFDQYGYLAGTDADRLADLDTAFADPDVRGIFASRGGYGTQRVVDDIDFGDIRRRPKVVVGFSDITSLQGRLWREAKLVTIHGPMVNWSDGRTGPECAEALRKAVMTTDEVIVTRDPAEVTAPVMVAGKATGALLGGNLTMLDTAVGAGDFPDLDGAILFFEEVGEAPYRIDRMLTRLRRTGALHEVAGIVIGQVIDSAGDPGEWDVVAMLRDRLGDLDVPVLGGLRLGHGKGQLTIPLGSTATIDAEAGTLTVKAGVAAP